MVIVAILIFGSDLWRPKSDETGVSQSCRIV